MRNLEFRVITPPFRTHIHTRAATKFDKGGGGTEGIGAVGRTGKYEGSNLDLVGVGLYRMSHKNLVAVRQHIT